MFEMAVEGQVNIGDKTIIGGRAKYDLIPEQVVIDNKVFKILGVSQGIKPPFFAIEIEKTDFDFVGLKISSLQNNYDKTYTG